MFSDYQLLVNDHLTLKTKVYPNPVTNQLFISSENTSIETISIYSLTGIKIKEVANEFSSIDVSRLSKGVYFIEISSDSGKTLKRFIKN